MPQSSGETRCHGRTGVAGKPLPPCVLCERRVIPHGQRVQLMVPPILRKGGEWVCDMRILYAQRVGA
jgi:hypothetical protein